MRSIIGQARIVKRRTPTFPSRVAPYFDFSPWRGGLMRATNNGPGAIVLDGARGIMADMQTGKVYTDR